jgi:transposase
MWKIGIEVRKDMTAAVLRRKARSEKNGRLAARMLGIANILDGMDRAAAARAVGMDRQTLCDWVHRYNKEGLAGLGNRPQGRPQRRLSKEQEQEIEDLVSKAPDGNLVRWRCADIKAEIKKRYGIVLHESTVGALLRRLGFRRMSVRPLHPENDPEALEAFKKTLLLACQKSSRLTPKARRSSSGSKMKRASDKKER